jgi:hypothetical protein
LGYKHIAILNNRVFSNIQRQLKSEEIAHAHYLGRVFSQRKSFYQISEDFRRTEIQNNVKIERDHYITSCCVRI